MGQNRFVKNFLTTLLIHFNKLASNHVINKIIDFKQVLFKSADFTKDLFRLDEPYLLYRVKVKLRYIHNKIFV